MEKIFDDGTIINKIFFSSRNFSCHSLKGFHKGDIFLRGYRGRHIRGSLYNVFKGE